MRSQFAGVRKTGAISSSQLCLTVSALALAMAAPGVAMAQDAPPPQDEQAVEVEEVVVTGLRRGLADSISIKRNETSIVEAISAEDIGKLPDVSIAESIARLPGLAAQRVNGRAQVISIRGLAPDFTTTLLNGRQQASSGDNRAVEFDQYPSELLSSVVVYKTPDAEISGMGLSGSADLRTVRPLEFGNRALALNLRGEMVEDGDLNDDVRSYGGRFSVSYIDQFMDDTLGVAIGYAHLDSPSVNRHYKAYGYEAFGFAVTPDSADDALILNGQEVFATSRLNQRDAVIGIVEWRPNDRLHTTIDLYYSKFDQEETMRGAQWFSNGWADGATFTDVQTEERGGSSLATSGTLNGGVPIIRNDFNTRQDEIFSAGINQEFQVDDRTRLIADLSYSQNERSESVAETYAGYGLGTNLAAGPGADGRTADTIDFLIPEEGYPTYGPGLDYADASQVSLGDRAPWGGWGHDGSIRFPDVEESILSGDIKGERDLEGPFTRISAGVNYANREKSKRVDDFDLFLRNGRQQILVDPQYLVEPTDLSFAGFGPVLSVDLARAMDVYYERAPILDANFFDKNWDISETVTTAFVKADFELANVRGNFGLQVVHQDQESTGVIINGLEPGQPIIPTSVTRGDSYVDVLPSMNLIARITDDMRMRIAVSRTMARPRMDEMRANVTPSFNGLICNDIGPGGQSVCANGGTVNPWSASGGNPNLEPWRATAFDLAYEWYASPTTYLSIAGFYKKLDNYIYSRTDQFDFTGIPLPVAGQLILQDPANAGVTISPIGQITLPDNGPGGRVHGFEFSGAFDFGMISDALEGFGVLGSLSLTKSNLNPADNGQEVKIPGLSGTVYNITAYYERGGFQARISQRYRSAFKGEVVQLFTNRGFTEIQEDEQIDAQIGYTFEAGPLDGLGLLFQVNNLTNSPYRTRLGLDSGGTTTADGTVLPETYEEYGRQFLFGVNYRF